MGGQADILFFWLRGERGLIASVQLSKCLLGRMAVADLVKNLNKRHVLLSIDVFQLYGDIVYLLQSFRTEEVGSVVI